ncbi:MAG: hypothetical protein FWH32_02405 [Clostridiales bacterium]|nr:hypothetical protein [Clostridiales bacterium]
MPEISEMKNLLETIKKADAGDADAQYRVAWYMIYEDQKEEVGVDWGERAVEYFELAGSQGHGDAMLDLGAMYIAGRGVKYDKEKAVYWYKKAAEMLYPKAFRCLIYALDIPCEYFDPQTDDTNYRAIYEYAFKGALLGEQNALYILGDLFFSGKYARRNQRLAYDLFCKSWDLIDDKEDDCYADVCLRIGECYLKGMAEIQDVEEAEDYLRHAMESYEFRRANGDLAEFIDPGYNRAQALIKEINSGKAYEGLNPITEHSEDGYNGFLTKMENFDENSYEEAFLLYTRYAMSGGDVRKEALSNLSLMYKNGLGVEKDEAFAALCGSKSLEGTGDN